MRAHRAKGTFDSLLRKRQLDSDLDEELRAKVELDVDSNLALPADTSAAIRTAGMLGSQFIALEPGAEEDLLVSGDELSFTEGAFNIEKLVGTLVHNIQIGSGE